MIRTDALFSRAIPFANAEASAKVGNERDVIVISNVHAHRRATAIGDQAATLLARPGGACCYTARATPMSMRTQPTMNAKPALH